MHASIDQIGRTVQVALGVDTKITGAKMAGKIADRGRYSDLTDSVLYESADSYAQTRLLYLQNRRFELGQTSNEGSFVDPYEDPYAE